MSKCSMCGNVDNRLDDPEEKNLVHVMKVGICTKCYLLESNLFSTKHYQSLIDEENLRNEIKSEAKLHIERRSLIRRE